MLRKATAEASYSPQVCGDGLEGLNLARSEAFDLILLDVMLPGLTGFEFCRQARAAKLMTPILLITARDALCDKDTIKTAIGEVIQPAKRKQIRDDLLQ